MQTFAAQVTTADTELDVSITLSSSRVQIDAGDDRLGRWSSKECTFERIAPAAYELRLPNERVHVRVIDDHGFRDAIALLREEQGVLVPRPLLWLGVAAIAAAVVGSAVIGGEPTAQAEPADDVAVAPTQLPSTTVAFATSTTLEAPDPATPAILDADHLLGQWNDVAAGTVLEVTTVGVNELRDLTVTILDGSVTVEASPTGSADNAESIMGALGVTIAAVDPSVAPSNRASILSELGLHVNAANPDPIQATLVHDGVTYSLDFEPGVLVRLSAGWEW